MEYKISVILKSGIQFDFKLPELPSKSLVEFDAIKIKGSKGADHLIPNHSIEYITVEEIKDET